MADRFPIIIREQDPEFLARLKAGPPILRAIQRAEDIKSLFNEPIHYHKRRWTFLGFGGLYDSLTLDTVGEVVSDLLGIVHNVDQIEEPHRDNCTGSYINGAEPIGYWNFSAAIVERELSVSSSIDYRADIKFKTKLLSGRITSTKPQRKSRDLRVLSYGAYAQFLRKGPQRNNLERLSRQLTDEPCGMRIHIGIRIPQLDKDEYSKLLDLHSTLSRYRIP
jgi:hypothetical protein